MRTPHQIWHKSARPYRESCAGWEYPSGSEVKEVDSIGQCRLDRKRYYISKALAGREVGIIVYYRTLFRIGYVALRRLAAMKKVS